MQNGFNQSEHLSLLCLKYKKVLFSLELRILWDEYLAYVDTKRI